MKAGVSWVILVSLVAPLMLIVAKPGRVSAQIAREQIEEIQIGWRKLAAMDDSDKTYQLSSMEKANKDIQGIAKSYRVFVNSGGDHVFQTDHLVYAHSNLYDFAIVRNDPSVDWRMTMYWNKDETAASEAPSIGHKYTLLHPLTAYGLREATSQFADDPEFSFTSLRPENESLVRVEFRRTIESREGKKGTVTGYMILDPRRLWVVLTSTRRSTLAPGIEFEVHRELLPDAAGKPRCASYENIARESTTKNVKTMIRYEFHDYSDGPIDPEVFRLTHYGLPEPISLRQAAHTPTYIWLLVAAAGCGVIAFAFRRFAKGKPTASVTG
jgi:hypothetical protein